MKAHWEEVPRDDVMPQYSGIYVTMNPKGDIMMSRVTYQLLDEPPAFVIYFDKVNNRIGLKPAQLATKNAYPTRSVNTRSGAKMVRGHRMTRIYRINLPQTVRFFDADIDEEGLLVLDLRTARVPKRVLNHARNRDKSQNREQ